MKTVAIINQKGGCGKTTTAINLAGCFAAAGWRTLLVDMDPQSHCAAGLAIPEQRIDLTVADAMLAADDDAPSKPAIDPTRLLWRVSRNLDLAPSTLKLAALEASRGELAGKPDAERRLGRVLRHLAVHGNGYDICFVDCSPAFGLLAYNSLAAADEIIIPVETGFFSLQGSAKQVSTIKSLAKRLGVTPNHRLLATMFDPGSVLAKDLLEELHRRFPGRVIPQIIRFDSSLREAASFGQPVGEYAPDSIGAQDYDALATWLMGQGLGTPSGEPTREPRTIIERPSGTEPASASGPVQVIPGVADRTLKAVKPIAEAAAMPQQPATSRAADLAERARRLQKGKLPESPQIPVEPMNALAAPAATIAPPVDVEPDSSIPAVSVVVNQAPPPWHGASPQTELLSAIREPLAESKPVGWPVEVKPDADPTPVFRSPGVYQNEDGVWFVQPASAGRDLSIAGEFNGWSAEASPMRLNRELGVYELCLPLRPGAVQYRLVVDGQWVADPFNPLVATNPFGEANSVVVVRERRRPDALISRW